MSDAKKRILQLVEKYASASRLDERAGQRDAPMSVLKRHAGNLTAIKAEIERELDALIRGGAR